jgi:hypothetical protein
MSLRGATVRPELVEGRTRDAAIPERPANAPCATRSPPMHNRYALCVRLSLLLAMTLS